MSRIVRRDPPALAKRLVSAIGGEVRDEALLPEEFRLFRSEMRDTLRGITDAIKTLNERVLPLIVDHGKRLDDHEARIRALEATARRKKRKG